jgi:hypothetical protein
LFLVAGTASGAADGSVSGRLTDPQGRPVAGATVTAGSPGAGIRAIRSDAEGRFSFPPLPPGECKLVGSAPGFADVSQTIPVTSGSALTVNLQFVRLVESPDATLKVLASEDLLDANPGRPGAPISLPGYPIETASGGIKAPQYFAPGVAGDHDWPTQVCPRLRFSSLNAPPSAKAPSCAPARARFKSVPSLRSGAAGTAPPWMLLRLYALCYVIEFTLIPPKEGYRDGSGQFLSDYKVRAVLLRAFVRVLFGADAQRSGG